MYGSSFRGLGLGRYKRCTKEWVMAICRRKEKSTQKRLIWKCRIFTVLCRTGLLLTLRIETSNSVHWDFGSDSTRLVVGVWVGLIKCWRQQKVSFPVNSGMQKKHEQSPDSLNASFWGGAAMRGVCHKQRSRQDPSCWTGFASPKLG